MSEVQLASYEDVPYESNPFPATHPGSLAVVAMLLGMESAPVDRCRVLELGCASGGNLIPMALTLPQSRFMGIDLSPGQVASGQVRIDALGLSNIELRPLSLLEVDDRFGQFDYIICHGVYSWVPAEVQDKILAICKHRLSPQGVAYVSYNTYPGWHLWALVRGMLSFHGGHFADPPTRIRQTRAFLDLLAQAVKGSTDLYALLIADEVSELQSRQDSYLFHEHLEDVNTPTYFYQFAERAAAKGLQYLEEAHFSPPLPSSIPREVRSILQQLPVSLIHGEQYLDFLRGRSFRRTLLCHDDVQLRRPPSVETVTRLLVSASAKPKRPQPDPESNAVEEFAAADGRTVSSQDPVVKTALLCLWQLSPRLVPFAELWSNVAARLEQSSEPARECVRQGPLPLAESLLECYSAGLVDLHLHVPHFVLEPSERPVASPLARLQAAGDRLITNLRHMSTELEPFDRAVLGQLDGNHDRQGLVKVLTDLVAGDVLTIEVDGGPLKDPAQLRRVLSDALDCSLDRLAASALLVA